MNAPALVLLAAGASRRLGSPKALVALGADPRDTPLRRLLRAGADAEGPRPLVVVGAHRLEISAAAPASADDAVELLENPNWAEGRSGSVALAAASRAGRDLLLAPVDVPRVPARVFAALRQAWADAHAPARGWLAPWVPGDPAQPALGPEAAPSPAPAPVRRFGHPVLIGRDLAAELARCLTAPDAPASWRDRPLRLLRQRAKPLLAVRVDAPEILEDLDRPEDLAEIRRQES